MLFAERCRNTRDLGSVTPQENKKQSIHIIKKEIEKDGENNWDCSRKWSIRIRRGIFNRSSHSSFRTSGSDGLTDDDYNDYKQSSIRIIEKRR